LKFNISHTLSLNSIDDFTKRDLHHLLAGTMLRQKGVKNVTQAGCEKEWRIKGRIDMKKLNSDSDH